MTGSSPTAAPWGPTGSECTLPLQGDSPALPPCRAVPPGSLA